MKHLLLLLVSFSFTAFVSAQTLTTPPGGGNQKSLVKQYIGGLAYVKVIYNSPDVTSPTGDDRTGKIWGQLVPYGFTNLGFGNGNPGPWRAGANENTVIYFSHDMLFQGKPIKAGAYGFHVVAKETGPWLILLTNTSTAWGSFFYEESDEALRVEATPKESPFNEWLTFEFADRQADYTVCELRWENLALPFKIEVPNNNELYLAKMRADLKGVPGFSWQNWNQAAAFCLNNDVNLEEGLQWADAAISAPFIGQENFTTLSTKSQLLAKTGKAEDAAMVMDKAIKHPSATSFQIHAYGRQLIAQGKKEAAMKIFKYNHEKYAGAWPTEVGMARGLSALGKYEKAHEHAKIALSQAPDQLNKTSMEQALVKLKNKEDIN